MFMVIFLNFSCNNAVYCQYMTEGAGGSKSIWAIPRKTKRFSQRVFLRTITCRCQTARCPVDVGIRSYERARSTPSSSCCSFHFLCKNCNLHLELLSNFFGVIQTGCYVGSDLTALHCIHTTKSQNLLFHCPHEINRNNQTFKYFRFPCKQICHLKHVHVLFFVNQCSS